MAKRIKKDDYLYKEALAWMSWRYAIGITEIAGRNGQSEAEMSSKWWGKLAKRLIIKHNGQIMQPSEEGFVPGQASVKIIR